MKLRLHLIAAALIISLQCLKAQDHLSGHIINLLEDIALSSGEDMQAADYAETITRLADEPVNINSGNINEIKRLFFLTVFQVHSLVDYTKKHGDILSVMEISYIPGFDKELAALIDPFIEFGPSGKSGSSDRSVRFRSINNIIKYPEAEDDNYVGNNYKLLSKIRISRGAVEAYITAEKDKGEALLLPGYSPDFLSGSITYSPGTRLNSIIIGDYRVRFGQGLTVWNGFFRQPVPTEPRPMKNSSSIMPYSSSDENDFFRGIALSFRIKDINIMSFASLNMTDATTVYDENSEIHYISSFYSTGIHNTASALLKRNAVSENSYGLNINTLRKNLYFGLSAVYSGFSLPVLQGSDIRDMYDFKGSENASFSIDYAYLFRNSQLFGEFAVSNGVKTAFLQGVSLNPEGMVRCNVLYSRVSRGYNSFHGKSPGGRTFNKFNSSLLANIGAEILPGLRFSAGFLSDKDLWYNNISGDFPSSMKYLLRIRLQPAGPSGIISLTADLRHQAGEKALTPLRGVKKSIPFEKSNLRFSMESQPSDRLSLRTRIEKVVIDGSEDRGLLCYQSASYLFSRISLEIRGRVTVFSTGSYDTRIYAWEDDLLYNPYIRALYSDGSRSYLMIVFKPSKMMALRLKYAVSNINHETGTDRSDELKFQLALRF
ncbi:MAG: hypothetical protein U5K32_00345 [Bacteroidales bacterium]|nr:hypothetical protein [Bacteroidales bacterium]